MPWDHGTWTFEEPDRERFPCLDLAYRALEAGGAAPAVLNAADEVVDLWYRRAPWSEPSPNEVVTKLEGRMRELIAERANAMAGVEQTVARVVITWV